MEKPDHTYTLDHAYGFRCSDSRQNVYYNSEGNIVYVTASLGVILNKTDGTQKFFGGGEVQNTWTEIAPVNDIDRHTNDVICLNVNTNGNRNLAVSG